MRCPRMLLVAILTVPSSFAFACNTKSSAPSGVGSADAATVVATTTTTSIDASRTAPPFSSGPARTSDGLLTITGRESHAIHSHRGPPAMLEEATFEIDNRGSRSSRIEALAIEYMTSHVCDVAPSDVVSRPSVTSFAVRADAGVRSDAGATSIVVEAGRRVVVAVRFKSVSARYTHCDRFAFRVAFKVDEERAFAVAETSVEREAD